MARYETLRKGLAGRPVLVFGSAPDPVLPPEDVVAASRVICANGSARTAERVGLPSPYVTVVTPSIFTGTKLSNLEAREALRGLSTHHLVIKSKSYNRERVEEVAREIGFRYEELHFMPRRYQKFVVSLVSLDPFYFRRARARDTKVSTGMFGCALALYSGAAPCFVSGISFSRTGHSYSERDLVRNQLAGDMRFVRRALAARRKLELLGSHDTTG